MGTSTDNFYILLELPYDPPVTDQTHIKSALQRKQQEWTRWQDNPSKRGAALRCLDMVPEIERVMTDPRLRAEQAKAAVKLQKDMLRQFEAELRVLEGKGHLLPREVSSIAVKYKPYGVTREKVLQLACCPVSDRPPAKTPQIEPPGEILDAMAARTVRRNLEILDMPDLYTFLGEAPYASIKKLCAAAEERRREAQMSPAKNAKTTAASELAGLCMTVFEDFNAKQRYDRYLKISRYPALGDLIDIEFGRSRYISPQILLRLINFAVEKYRIGVLEAEEYIRRYCAAHKIPIDARSQRINCPACGAQADRCAHLCPACAQPLAGECPGCGAPFSEGAPVCTECGFALSDMVKALACIDEAQNAIIDNNWSTARRGVEYARKYWPGHPQLEPLEKRSRSLEDRYAQYMDNISDCVRHNQYYAALELVDEAEARRIRLPAATVKHVRQVVDHFEKRLAEFSGGKKELPIESVLELADIVGDSIELSRMMKKHPPAAPLFLKAAVTGTSVQLDWGQSASPGLMSYVLVRKKGSLPLTAYDGDILCDTQATSFEDLHAQPLCAYYYSIFSKRNDAFSPQGASTGPVLLIPEIEDLRIVPMDQGARLTWRVAPEICEVIIWRKLGGERPAEQGEGIRLACDRVDGFADTKIKNDVDYWYYIVAAYMVEGKKVYSRGVCERVTPHRFLAPIEHLIIAKTDDGEDEYVVNWAGAQQPGDLLLLASPKKPMHTNGEVLPVQELLAQYRSLNLEARGATGAFFQYALNGGVYIFPASVFGKFASVGQSYYLTNVKNVENPTFDLIGGELFINMKWPAGLAEIAVAYRFDRFPESAAEVGTTVILLTKEQYDYDAAVILREPESVVYYVKIYSVFRTPAGEEIHSGGVELEIDNTARQEVSYMLKAKKRLISSNVMVNISLLSETPVMLPKAVFVAKVGRLPLSKSDGIQLFEIERETKLNGELTYQYIADALPKDLYVRMFLYDDRLYRRFLLIPRDSVKLT